MRIVLKGLQMCLESHKGFQKIVLKGLQMCNVLKGLRMCLECLERAFKECLERASNVRCLSLCSSHCVMVGLLAATMAYHANEHSPCLMLLSI